MLWAERLDQPRDGAPGLSETTPLTLTAQFNRQVARHGLAAARRKPVEALTARELRLIGRDRHQRGAEADMAIAEDMPARAIAADPDRAQAYAVRRAITHGRGSLGARDLASSRHRALVVHTLKAGSDDATAARVAAAITSRLKAKSIQYARPRPGRAR